MYLLLVYTKIKNYDNNCEVFIKWVNKIIIPDIYCLGSKITTILFLKT